MSKTIAIVGTLDTKGKQIEYVKEQIHKRGLNTVTIDIGMGGEPLTRADISCQEVAEAGGSSIEKIRLLASQARDQANHIMIKGATKKTVELLSSGRLDGLLNVSGGSGSFMASRIMQAMPFGVPKLIVSSVAAVRGLASRYLGTKDIVVMYSVVEISGLSEMLKNVLDRAAAAICGMAEISPKLLATPGKARIAMTRFGFCEKCATYAEQFLEKKGYEVIGFPAQGIGDRAMEELIDEGFFDAVLDIATGGVSEELFGGDRKAGPNRLEAAGRKGIPQVIAPCGLNLWSPRKSSYKPEYKLRKSYSPDDLRTVIRLTPVEMKIVAQTVARKLNQAKGPVKVFIPLRGWMSMSRESEILYEPETDRVFVEELKALLEPNIGVREIDANLEDPEFARAMVSALTEMMGNRTQSSTTL